MRLRFSVCLHAAICACPLKQEAEVPHLENLRLFHRRTAVAHSTPRRAKKGGARMGAVSPLPCGKEGSAQPRYPVFQPPRYALRTSSLAISSAPVPESVTRPVSNT